MDKTAGILFAISSLPSKYGIGCFSKEAYKFVDWLVEAGQTFWQILPLGPTGYGDSPYQSFSTFAGNPYFIDLETLISEGLLTREECDSVDFGTDEQSVDYEKQYNGRYVLLRKACERSGHKNSTEYKAFLEKNEAWVYDYCLYMAVKNHFGGINWTEWPEAIHSRTEEGLREYKEKLADEIDFQLFMQFQFFNQWYKLRAYANKKGIKIIGDIPIYVSLDSADAWSHPELFQLDEQCTRKAVAGCPPDGFSADGQLWGNPLYDYDKMEANGFSWWRKRMAASAKLYDVIRIDHFIGIVKYYTIPADMPDARQGEYRQGPGQKLLDVINESIGDKKIIAEDLGVEVPEVAKILKENGYPGMKVLEFAFGGDRKNPHLPYNYTQNLVCYGGTHDNETLLGFFEDRGDWELGYAYDYLDTRDKGRMVDQVFRAAYSSVAVLTVFAVQDILKLGNWARMNLPSSMGNNWKWRMQKGQLGQHELECMRYLASVFDRERK